MPPERKESEVKDTQFVFIDNAGPITSTEKRKIRQQAMRKVAQTRRELGSYGKYNLGQYPVFEEPVVGAEAHFPTEEEIGESQAIASIPRNAPSRIKYTLPRSMPAQGYEAAKIAYNFDIFSLSALTSFHFSRGSARSLRADGNRLKSLLRANREASYLDYVPDLYNDNQLIHHIVDITLARAQQTLTARSPLPEAQVLAMYGAALLELQAALGNPTRRFDPDVLCATHLLALYELLDFSGSSKWEHHVTGAIQLVELRGADRYASEFEKFLLSCSVGTIFSETTLSNKDCFLEKTEWSNTLLSLGLPNHVHMERHPFVLEIWKIVSPVPRLFRRVTELVLSSNEDQNPSEINHLILRCYHVRDSISRWRMYMEKGAEICEEKSHEHHKHRENLGVAMATQCMVQRLIVALEPLGENAEKFEKETQELSYRIISMSREMVDQANPRLDILLAQKSAIAGAMVETATDWLAAVQGSADAVGPGRSHISGALFRKWSDLMGRRIE